MSIDKMAANNRHANVIFLPHCFNIIFNAIPRFRLVGIRWYIYTFQQCLMQLPHQWYWLWQPWLNWEPLAAALCVTKIHWNWKVFCPSTQIYAKVFWTERVKQPTTECLTLGLPRGMNGVILKFCYSGDYPTQRWWIRVSNNKRVSVFCACRE